MASPLVQAQIKAPGFLGLNTEQAASQSVERFATQFDNGVWDDSGKVVCRKGFDPSVTHTDTIDRLYWWRKDRTTTKLVATADSSGAKLYEVTQTTNPYDTMTSIGTIHDTDVMFANVNGYLCFSSQGNSLKYWDGTTLADFAAATGTTANPTGGICVSAFGRFFVTSSDGKTVYGSELQPNPSTGMNWDNWFIDTTGNTGATAKDGWTYGRDYITGLGALGDFLVIFGSESILVFQDVNGTVTLADSITGVGCISAHSVKNVGDDLAFLSNSGLRSLRRTLEKDSPQQDDLSQHVRTDLMHAVTAGDVDAVYSQLDGWYLLADSEIAYAFDMRLPLPTGARRASKWTLTPQAMTYDPEGNTVYMAVGTKIGTYSGYQDDSATYKFTLKSAWLDINSQQIKIAKKLAAIIYGGDGYSPAFTIAFDFNENGEETTFGEVLPLPVVTEWSEVPDAEWGVGQWSQSETQINDRIVQASGSGLFVRYGLEFIVDQYQVGIQEVRMMAKLGKLAHV